MSTSTLPVVTPSPELISQLLEEQQKLTAVEQFSALHDRMDADPDAAPLQSKYYRELLPATPPGRGQQYAFEVDLDRCSGCKACVVACHTLNGLEEDESWRRVGTLTIGSPQPSIQHVTTACHHCEDPGCLNGCPVKAYDKDPETGIVRHLDDQCIGCKYCTMMCPYEVPKYSDRLGIVRKCDMCHQRLAVGEAPACVQACPNEAIRISTVAAESNPETDVRLAPGAPESWITKPTTRYLSENRGSIDASHPQDGGIDEVAESHWPLAVMLVATQVSVGMILVERMMAMTAGTAVEFTRCVALVSLLIAGAGLNIASLHLGQPLRAWRVFLGLRTSWLSREAIVFGKYVGLLALSTGLLWMPVFEGYVPSSVRGWIPGWAAGVSLSVTALVGVLGLFTSAMIYVATKRQLWRSARTFTRFFGTMAVTAPAVLTGILGLTAAPVPWPMALLALGGVTLLATKVAWEWSIHLGPHETGDSYDRRSRALVASKLKSLAQLRVVGGIVGAVLLALAVPVVFFLPVLAGWVALASAIAIVAGELAERWLYFSSVVYDRMPGTL